MYYNVCVCRHVRTCTMHKSLFIMPFILLAPPVRMGAWSLACVLRKQIECIKINNYNKVHACTNCALVVYSKCMVYPFMYQCVHIHMHESYTNRDQSSRLTEVRVKGCHSNRATDGTLTKTYCPASA